MNDFDNLENNEMLDLGSEPVADDFDPFAFDEELDGMTVETEVPQSQKEDTAQQKENGTDTAVKTEIPTVTDTEKYVNSPEETNVPETKEAAPKEAKSKGTKTVTAEQSYENKLPVFAYAGALEDISDVSMTFEELRIEKSVDFPELEDGKRVSWTVEYGKVTKSVPDPKGTSIGRMKDEIETSKEFLTGLKRAKDKHPVCKVKPRVTAQSKGTASSYKGIFPTMEEAEAAGKMISIVPSRDGKVYEIRDTEMGKFVTPASGCEMLSEVQAGFTPALPRIPMELFMQALSFFRRFIQHGTENEALLNIY